MADAAGCPDERGTFPIIESGRDGEIQGLFAPHMIGEDVVGTSGVTFEGLAIEPTAIRATLRSAAGDAVLVLRAAECHPDDAQASGSFSYAREIPPQSGERLRQALDALERSVRSQDSGNFWKTRSNRRADDANPGRSGFPLFSTSMNETILGLLMILLGAIFFLGIDLREWWRQSGFQGPDGRRVLWAVLGITALGACLRFGIDATFIREAYAIPSIAWLGESIDLGSPIDAYPQGPDLVVSSLGLLLADDPFDAWFVTHQLIGSLSVFLAYGAAKEMSGTAAVGVIAAALLAFWPQHIRVSASEVTHVHLIFWTLLVLNWAFLASRTGRMRSFFALSWLAATMCIMRPEAPLLLLGVGLIALTHGSGIRLKFRSVPRWMMLALVVWLIVPTFLTILADKSIDNFTASQHSESVGFDSIIDTLACLVIPDGRNAFFDPQTSPLWLWPLCLWGGVVLWRQGRRGAALGLGAIVLTFLTLYSGLPYAVTLWKMSRYHATMLPAVVLLTAAGTWDIFGRLKWTGRNAATRTMAGVMLAASGCALWSPALSGLPLDWQRDKEIAIEFGRSHPVLWGDDVRIITPDNRRRFLDLSPRSYISALTRGRQEARMAVTVPFAVATLGVGAPAPKAYFFGGLYCYLAVLPGETINPQCAAMERTFELKEIARATLDEAAYLVAYQDTRIRGPLTLRLYEVGRRKLSPTDAAALIPAPLTPDHAGSVSGYPVGASTSPFMDAPQPPIDAPLGPAFKQVPW